jgi:hypothetical protein
MRLTATHKTLAAAALALGAILSGVTPASAGYPQNTVVSANPANVTPNINDGAVNALVQIGTTMYAGGDFTSVTPSTGGAALTRRGIVAFNASTGAITAFAPVFNGAVWTLSTDGTSLYVGGSFTSAAGLARPYLAKLNPSTGAVDPAFSAGLNQQVSDSAVVAGRLIVGGRFTGALRAVNLATGANTGYINFAFSSTLGPNAGPLGIYRFSVNSAGTRLVAIGNFTSVGGQAHPRAVMVNLGPTATVNTWYYAGLTKMCEISTVPNYLRGVDFSPDGSYFVLVSTGRNPLTAADYGVAICDAAARFETGIDRPARPTWMNYTGGDTFHSVNVTNAAVYVQGHFRWLDNEGGSDSQGPNGVSRPGIGALNPATGRSLPWNPGKERGVGGKVMLSTSTGLWVGSDTARFAGELRARVAFCPL